jgi:predicted transcriptional regulator
MQGYLQLLIKSGLLEYVENERIYHTTDNGKRFLKMYGEVNIMVPKENMLTKVLQR